LFLSIIFIFIEPSSLIPPSEKYILSFCMVFGSSQRIDNIIFRLRSKRDNERETNSKCYAYRSKFLYTHIHTCIHKNSFNLILFGKLKKKSNIIAYHIHTHMYIYYLEDLDFCCRSSKRLINSS